MKTWRVILLTIFAIFIVGIANAEPPSAAPRAVQKHEAASLQGASAAAKSPAGQSAPASPTTRKEAAPSFSKELDDTLSNYTSLAWKFFLALALPMAAWLFIQEWRRDALVIEPLDIPKELQELGISGMVMSQLLSDHVFELQRSARLDDDPTDIIFVELPKMQLDLQLPGMAWSLRGLIRYLKQAFGKQERRLIGEVVRKRTVYTIRLRLTSGRASDVPVSFHNTFDLDGALKSAAEVAVTLINPLEAASINYARETVAMGYANTIRSLKLYLATTPASMHQDAYVLWASVCRAVGDFEALEEKLRQAEMANAKLWKGRASGHLGIRYRNFVGNLHRERLEFPKAEASFKKVIRSSRKNLGAMANLGLLYYDAWQLDDARLWFRRVTRSRPNSSRGYRGLGLVALRSGKLDEALRFFERAIDLAPFARWPRINHIEALRRKGNYSGMLKAIEDFQKIDAQFPPFLRAWAEALVDMNELGAALGKYQESIRLNPFDPWTYVAQAILLRRLGRLADAEASISKAVELRPNLPSAVIFKADLLVRQGDNQGSLEALHRLTRVASHDPYAFSRLIDELRRQGQLATAKKILSDMPLHCQRSPEGLRARGWVHLDDNKLDAALENFRHAINAAPYEPWSYFGVAEVFRRRSKYEDAIAAVDSGLKVRPLFLDAHLRYGDILLDSGDIDGALRKYRDAIQVAPQDPGGYLALANGLRRQNQHADALAVLDQALKVRPNMPDALRRYGDVLHDAGDVDGAVKKYQEAIQEPSRDPWGQLALANLLRSLERYGDAEAAVGNALTMRPEFLEAHLCHADILRDGGDLDGALSSVRNAVLAAPQNPWVHVALADLLRRQEKYDDAMAAVTDALRLRPNSVDAHLRHGDILRDRGNLDGAAKSYRNAIQAAPRNPWLRLALGDVLRRQEKYDDAIETINAALTLWPDMPEALRRYGDVLRDRGDADGALEKYRDAIRAAPQDTQGYLTLANALRRQEKYDDAIAAVKEALKLGRNMPAVLRRHARILDTRRDLDGAAKKYRDAIDAAPQNPEGYLALADVLRRQEKYADAMAAIEGALKLRPDMPEALQRSRDIMEASRVAH